MYVYLFYREEDGLTKIGRAVNYSRRFYELTHSSCPLIVRAAYRTPSHIKDETQLHRIFADKRRRGEWFALDHADIRRINEYFGLAPDFVGIFPENTKRTMYPCKCVRCGNEWMGLTPDPRCCTSCHSYKWREPRRASASTGGE